MTRTPSRTRTRTTRSSEHTARRPLMHSVSHRTCGSRLPRVCHPCHPCMRTCGWCLELSVFFLVSFVFYLASLFFFQPFLMSTSAYNERSMSNPLCYSSLGSVVTSDYVTPSQVPATSESNSFIQLSLYEIFGGGRRDTHIPSGI